MRDRVGIAFSDAHVPLVAVLLVELLLDVLCSVLQIMSSHRRRRRTTTRRRSRVEADDEEQQDGEVDVGYKEKEMQNRWSTRRR